MSWGIKIAGTKDDVKAVLNEQTYIPDAVKGMILTQMGQLKLDPQWAGDKNQYQVLVETHGHIDDMTMDVHFNVSRVACALKGPSAAALTPHNDA